MPPPIHGVTVLNEIIYNSSVITNDLVKDILKIEFSRNLTTLNRFKLSKFIVFFTLLFRLYDKIKVFKPDFIYFTIVPTGLGFYRDCIFTLLIKYSRVNVIYHLHGKGIREASRNFVLKKLYKYIFSNSIILISSYGLQRRELDPLQLKNAQIYVLPNGVKTNLNSKKITFKKSKPIKLLYVSNISKSKGIFFLLNALLVLKKKNIDFKLDIVGGFLNKSAKNSLENMITSNSLQEHIKFHGYINETEKDFFFNSSDIFIHPSLNENFGLVIIEAMQYGLPVISTYEGAIPEIIDNGITGILVNKNDIDELAKKIILLINNDDLRKKLGEKGREKFLKKYTLRTFENNIKKIFDEI